MSFLTHTLPYLRLLTDDDHHTYKEGLHQVGAVPGTGRGGGGNDRGATGEHAEQQDNEVRRESDTGEILREGDEWERIDGL